MPRHRFQFRPFLFQFEERNAPVGHAFGFDPGLDAVPNNTPVVKPSFDSWLGDSKRCDDGTDFLALSFEAPAPLSNHGHYESTLGLRPKDEAAAKAPATLGFQLSAPSPDSGQFSTYAGAIFAIQPQSGDSATPPTEHATPFRNPIATPLYDDSAETPTASFSPDDRAAVRCATGEWVGLSAPGHALTNVLAETGAQTTASNLPYGLFAFEVHNVAPGGAATVQMTLPENAHPTTVSLPEMLSVLAA